MDAVATDEQNCGNCRFFFFPKPDLWDNSVRGECRQRPPVVIARKRSIATGGGNHNIIETRWPEVAADDDWCGKWRARDSDGRNAAE